MPSTTNVSERVAAPPSLSTVSSLSVPPLEMKVPSARGTPACRAPVITSTSPATGLLCRSMMPELVNVVTPIKWPCNGPPSAIALLGFPSGRYCPVLSSVVAPVTAGSLSVPLLVKLLFGPSPRSAMATRSVSRPPPSGVGEVPQVEQAIVEDAVIAAGELHEAGDGAVVDDHRIAGNSAVGQRADAAVIGQGRGAPGRAQDNAGGR